MAIVVENFTYSNGNIDGQNGGTGWGGAWSGDTQLQIVSNEAAITNPGSGYGVSRTFSDTFANGVLRIKMKNSATNIPGAQININSSGTPMCIVRMENTGNIVAYDNLTQDTIIAYSADTWYYVEISFDCDTDTYQVKASTTEGGGTWSDSKAFFNGGTAATLDGVSIRNANNFTGTCYWDNLSFEISDSISIPNRIGLLGVG